MSSFRGSNQKGSEPRNEGNDQKNKRRKKKTSNDLKKFYTKRKAGRIEMALAKTSTDPLAMTEAEEDTFQAIPQNPTMAVEPAVQIVLEEVLEAAVNTVLEEAVEAVVKIVVVEILAAEKDDLGAIPNNPNPVAIPEQEAQTLEVIQKSSSESSLGSTSKEPFTAVQYPPLGLIKMMFANRIFQEEVAMLVQETAQEVAEEYIAEMTESTLDLEEVVKQFRPLDFISMRLAKEILQEEVVRLIVQETAQAKAESESRVKQRVQEHEPRQETPQIPLDKEPEVAQTIDTLMSDKPPPPVSVVVLAVNRYNLRSSRKVNELETPMMVQELVSRPRKKRTVKTVTVPKSTEVLVEPRRVHLMDFSNEIITKILSFLSFEEIERLRLVNKCFYANGQHLLTLSFRKVKKSVEDICEEVYLYTESERGMGIYADLNPIQFDRSHLFSTYRLACQIVDGDLYYLYYEHSVGVDFDNIIYGKLIDLCYQFLRMMKSALKTKTVSRGPMMKLLKEIQHHYRLASNYVHEYKIEKAHQRVKELGL